MSRKNAIVVGMPRSGTSLTASLFAKQGYFLAENQKSELREGDHDNPLGYFEAESLIDANVGVFSRAGYPCHNTWLYEPIADECADAIRTLEIADEDRELVSRYQEHAPWAWKDPRLCYTLPYWWRAVDHSSTAVVLVRRDARSIWNSFVRLGWRDNTESNRQDIESRIASHIGAAEQAIRELDIPHVVVDYARFEADPEALVAEINAALGTELTVEETGYRKTYNHSSMYGSIEKAIKLLKRLVPGPIKRAIRRGG